jgi:hypothetical protein
MTHTTTIDFAIGSAPVDWQKAANRWISRGPGYDEFPPLANRSTMGEAISELDAAIIHLTRLRGYLDGRYGHGCGDQGHADSVKSSNKLVAKVRKALGYTIAKADVIF